jgi:hypothetical protein
MIGFLVAVLAIVAFNCVFATLVLPDDLTGGVWALWLMWCVLTGWLAGTAGTRWDNKRRQR